MSGDAILKALTAAMESAPSALAARSVLEGFDAAIKYCPQTALDCSCLIVILAVVFGFLSKDLKNCAPSALAAWSVLKKVDAAIK